MEVSGHFHNLLLSWHVKEKNLIRVGSRENLRTVSEVMAFKGVGYWASGQEERQSIRTQVGS